jgi:hypothetical protein
VVAGRRKPDSNKSQIGHMEENLRRLGLVALVGLLEMDRLWYITVGNTHPRVFLSEDAFLAGGSWPPEVLTKGDGESADG